MRALPRLSAPGWMLVLALSVLSVVVVERGLQPPAPAPAAVRTLKLPDSVPKTWAEALAKADVEIANAKARAEQRPDEWTLLEALARRQVARAKLTGSFEDYAAAQATYDRAFAVARPGTGPHLSQAVLHFTMHRLAGAERDLDTIDRYAVPPDLEERAELAAMRGDIAFYRGDLPGALGWYRKAEKLEPGAGTAFRQAVYKTKTGRLTEAEALFDKSVKASRMATPQQRAATELQKGTLWLERGQWDRALAYFRRADAIFPGHWSIEEHIAETLALKGETAEAERLYAGIVARTGNPEFMDALAGLALRRGDEAAARAWAAKAEAVWERWLKLFPEAAYGHALEHYLAFGDPGRALEIARLNAAARPYGDAKVMLAEALLKAGRAQEARTVVEGVLRTPWNTAQLHGVASRVYAAVGDEGRAARQRRLALAMNPHELDDATPLKAFN